MEYGNKMRIFEGAEESEVKIEIKLAKWNYNQSTN